MKPSRFLAEAEQEMLAAADFYEYRAAGLGREFLTEIKPKNLSWTGWSVRFCGCRARRDDE